MPHLVDRFYQGGLYNSPYDEIVHLGPQRQETLIRLAEKSIELQRKAAQDIARSQIEAADRVAAEVRQQTADLERMVADQGDRLAHAVSDAAEWISGSIGSAANEISDAVFALGERLGIELAELRWQMEQANLSLSEILKTLQHRRRTEASELVQQGVRHSLYGEYVEAEERFLLALKLDSTDYQVLMNLGYIEVHKDNGAEAIRFFDKASKLPPPEILSADAKAEALWARARVHYAQRQYAEALQYGTQSIAVASHPQRVFTVGVYTALAGDTSLALRRLEEAIRQSPDLFVRAATDLELDGLRKQVWKLLGKMAVEVARLVEQHLAVATKAVNNLQDEYNSTRYLDCMHHITQVLNEMTSRSKSASYRFHRWAADGLDTLIAALEEVASSSHSGPKLIKGKKERQTLETAYKALEGEYKELDIEYCQLTSQKYAREAEPIHKSDCGFIWIIASILIGIITAIKYIEWTSIGDIFWIIVASILWPITIIQNLFFGRHRESGWFAFNTMLVCYSFVILCVINNRFNARNKEREIINLADKLGNIRGEMSAIKQQQESNLQQQRNCNDAVNKLSSVVNQLVSALQDR